VIASAIADGGRAVSKNATTDRSSGRHDHKFIEEKRLVVNKTKILPSFVFWGGGEK
jgi:hypothetical protein